MNKIIGTEAWRRLYNLIIDFEKDRKLDCKQKEIWNTYRYLSMKSFYLDNKDPICEKIDFRRGEILASALEVLNEA